MWELKLAALNALWPAARAHTTFAAWARREGDRIRTFATYAALAELHGADWRIWPQRLRRHDGPAVSSWVAEPAAADRIRFHIWLQWLLEVQLTAAARVGPGVVGDLAIGADPGGADAWEWQDVTACGVSVGAPPDEFSPTGQDWGFAPFDPWRLRATGYGPFIDVVRAALAHGVGLRVDHVMGLFRQFWVPSSGAPDEGVYVSFPWADLCNIVALESQRAGAWVVGEDLGTVEPSVREQLAARNFLSYRLLWFEDDAPSDWPAQALAAITTHDLPTVSGLWNGTDAAARRRAGMAVDDEADARLRRRLVHAAADPVAQGGQGAPGGEGAPGGQGGPAGPGGPGGPGIDVARRAYAALAESPCLVVAATLEDALDVAERPNLPGTVNQRPNWSLALPNTIEEIERDPRPSALAATFREFRHP